MTTQTQTSAPSPWHQRTILVTGGGSGIGLGLATRLHAAGHTVVVCGRRAEKLAEAAALGLHTHVADVATAAGREALITWMVATWPTFDTLINNAGIQLRGPLAPAQRPWAEQALEIETNLAAPIHLAQLALPHLLTRPVASLVNVTSGLAFTPLAFVPVYCATKAALHSFTMSLRHQLRETPVAVVELAPPAVNTDLGGAGLHNFGVALDEFADAVVPRLLAGELEFGYGFSETARLAGREGREAAFARMNAG